MRTPPRIAWLTSLLVFTGVFIASIGWAISMPIGAGPDESAHVLKAASVVRGEFIGEPTDAPAVTKVRVPASLTDSSAWACFAFHPAESGDCQGELEAESGLAYAETSAGIYNPGYYLVVGWPSLITESPTAIVWGMRALTALGSALLATAIFSVLGRMMSRLLSLTIFGALVTPMVLFLNAIVNPNAWEIVGGVGFLVGLLWFSTANDVRGKGALLPAALVAVGGFVSANARGVSPFWLFLFGILFLIATPWPRIRELMRTPVFLLGLGVAVLGAICGAAWTLMTGTLNRMGDFPGQEMSPLVAFFRMVINAPSDYGLFGIFGWLDTSAPGMVYLIYGFTSLSLIVIGLAVADRRGRLLIGLAGAVFFFGPALLQAASVKGSGWIWQGRYSLVAFLGLLLISGLAAVMAGRRWEAANDFSGKVLDRVGCYSLTLMAVAQLWAFLANLQRYSAPGTPTIFEPLLRPGWQPALVGVRGATAIFCIGLLTLAAAAIISARAERGTALADRFAERSSKELSPGAA